VNDAAVVRPHKITLILPFYRAIARYELLTSQGFKLSENVYD